MEKILFHWIRDNIKGGVPVETWMVADEGKDILHNLHPLSFPDPSEFSDYPFKFISNW